MTSFLICAVELLVQGVGAGSIRSSVVWLAGGSPWDTHHYIKSMSVNLILFFEMAVSFVYAVLYKIGCL